MIFELISIGIFGLIIGSYLNVLILRFHTGNSTAGRSGCMSCGVTLSWYELIPVVSFFVLKGRCKACGSVISKQYWLVELATALLFMLVWMQSLSVLVTGIVLGILSILIVIVVYDIRHTIIPNALVYVFWVLSILAVFFNMQVVSVDTIVHTTLGMLVAGAVTTAPLFVLWAVSKGTWMGFGDVKLVLGFGFILGMFGGLSAVMFGFILGAVVGLALIYIPRVLQYLRIVQLQHILSFKSEIPFAPFLITGFLLVFLFHVNLSSVLVFGI